LPKGLVRRNIRLCLLLCLLAIPLFACDLLPPVTGNGTPVTSPTNGSQLNVWSRVAPGVEVRYEDWKNPGGDDDTVTIVRFDLHEVKLSVGYQPEQPLLMSGWMQQEQATAIINGGYFDQEDDATALVVSNGKAFGESYAGFGGMLSGAASSAMVLAVTLKSRLESGATPGSRLTSAIGTSMVMVPNGPVVKEHAPGAVICFVPG